MTFLSQFRTDVRNAGHSRKAWTHANDARIQNQDLSFEQELFYD